MKLTLIISAVVRTVRFLIGEDETRPRLIDRHHLDDPHADELFLVRDGKPVTFRQFNAEMSEHYAPRPVDPETYSLSPNAVRRFE